MLKYESNQGAARLEKLLLSAISNWQNKNEDVRLEDADLFVSEIFVNQGRILKRLRPAPQGRAHRIRKRSNHVTLVVESANSDLFNEEGIVNEAVEEIKTEDKTEK